MKRTFIIDGNSLGNRAFYALPFFTNPKGEPSGAVFGFANLLTKLITEEKPDEIIVAFDHARKTFRNDIFEDYKGTRKETPEELKVQFPMIKQMLKEMSITTLESDGIEADDIIGTITKQIEGKKILISGDRDLLQLISDEAEVWLTKKGVTDLQKLDVKTLSSEYGIEPFQVIEMKALMGDSSDNIPGVKGIGEKTAQKLIETYGEIDVIYKNINEIGGKLQEKLEQGKEMAYLSKQLATIKTDCEIAYKSDKLKFPFDVDVYKFFKRMGFSSLLKRESLFAEFEDEGDGFTIAKRIKIDKLEIVDELISKIRGEVAISLDKLEFSPNYQEVYYLEPRFDMFMETVEIEEVLSKMKGVFENEHIEKITLSAKSDMKKLDEIGIKYNRFFDISIARYVLYAGGNVSREDNGLNNYFAEKRDLEDLMAKHNVDKIYTDCEIPLVSVLFDMEKSGFKVDKNILDELDESFTITLTKITQEIYDLAGEEFNINSPKQVSSILFEKLKLSSWNNKKLSTSADILEEMIGQHPIVEKILLFRKYNKLKTTYIDVYQKTCAENGDVIHTTFHQSLTSTGRLSSSDPNLQNIPTRDENGKTLRKIFISKFDGGEIISADYNQIELRLLADMSGEQGLIDAYMRGDDIHSLTASRIFKVPMEKVTPAQRREAKAVNFGIIYGISDYGLSQNIKTTRVKAKEYIDSYFEKYPLVKKFSEDNVKFAEENGFIRTKFGRLRLIPEIRSSNKNIKMFAERVAMNMPLQGTASDIIKFAMIKVFDRIKNMKSELILQIHDELIIDTFPGEEEQIKSILHECMENVIKLKISLPISIGEGKSLFDCKD